MARLMAIPIRDNGHAILIVAHRDGVALLGFVAQATLEACSGRPLSMCQCLARVERDIDWFERILLLKSLRNAYFDDAIECVEITLDDLKGTLAPPRRS